MMEAQSISSRLTLTVNEAASLLGVSLPTAYHLVHREDFPTLRIGRKLLVSREGLERWIADQASAGQGR